ncbi:MAG: hypothetical protein L0Y38_01205 [Methylococcaceae bacterium]|nr:hypothetical protein [Methylococcaceae bacterium]MCI0732423.1 hypothetical protein [Methylococcaceae bacterium]
MLTTRWQKLWLLTALALLFFPCIFVLTELPTEAKILQRWSTSMLWKIQAEIPEYRELGVWYIRQQYEGLSDREMIALLESRYKGIDFSEIRKKHGALLENIRWNQALVIGEASSIYLSAIAVLYINYWFAGCIARRLGSSRSRRNAGG